VMVFEPSGKPHPGTKNKIKAIYNVFFIEDVLLIQQLIL